MYKELFFLLLRLTVSPEKTWMRLSEKQEEETQEKFYASYLYPVIGIIALFAFAGILLKDGFNVQLGLKTVIKEVVTYFFSFYASAYVLSKLLTSYFAFPCDQQNSERFVAYSSAVIYVVAILYSLFPSFFFLNIFALYTVYIIWQGTVYYLRLPEANWVKFTTFASLVIILMPGILAWIISKLMPGL
jgi:hypothetical protein